MPVADTVRTLMLEYPTTFSDRTQALRQLLFGDGTGWEWQNGEMVTYMAYHRSDHIPTSPDPEVEFQRDLARLRAQGHTPSDNCVVTRTLATEHAATAKHIYDNIDELVHIPVQFERMSPIYEGSSPMVNIPDDVTDDWLDACEELAHQVLACQHSTYLFDGDLDTDEERHARWHAQQPTTAAARAFLEELAAEIASEHNRPAPPPPKPDAEQLAELDAERQVRLEANASTVTRNHAAARKALERVAQLRAARAAA